MLISFSLINGYLSILENAVLGLAFVLFIFFINKIDEKSLHYFKIIRWYIVFEIVIKVGMHSFIHISNTNLVVTHFFFLGNFLILTWLYYHLLIGWQKVFVKIMVAIVIFVLMIHYYFYPHYFWTFNSFEVAITSIPLLGYSILHLYNQLVNSNVLVYINVGILMYISVSSLIFILGDFLTKQSLQMTYEIWLINRVLFIAYISLFILEFYHGRKSKSVIN